MPTALSLPRCVQVVADYEDRGYSFVRDTEIGVVLRHPNGGIVTVLANGETRGGDKAGPERRARRPPVVGRADLHVARVDSASRGRTTLGAVRSGPLPWSRRRPARRGSCGAPELCCDRLGNALRRRGRVFHAAGPRRGGEPVRDVEPLLEVALEREAEEWPPRRDELHRRRQPALHDGDVAGGEPAVQVVDIAVQLDAAAESSPASMRGPQTATMRRSGTQPPRGRLAASTA